MLHRRSWVVLAASAAVAPIRSARADIPRLGKIRKRAEPRIHALFEKAGVSYPPKQMLLRAFKADDQFELWAASESEGPLVLVKQYAVCEKSGVLGPKRTYGDLQVPEGFYEIHRFNAWSAYHLSIRVNYPNRSDKIRGRGWGLGGAIMVHGDCVTIGCIPLQNNPIEEVFIAVLDAHRANRARVPIHIFPTRLTPDALEKLDEAGHDAKLLEFWRELAIGYEAFEESKNVPRIEIDTKTGAYRVLAVPSEWNSDR